MTGCNPFAARYNTNYHKSVQDFGGLPHLVTTNVARNMWAIMKLFHVLPNDKRLQTLSPEQLDFIILSMREDNEEIRRAKYGLETSHKYVDNEMVRMANVPDSEFELVHKGHDMKKIAQQVSERTMDPEFNERHRQIMNAVYTKDIPQKLQQLDTINRFQQEQIKRAREENTRREQSKQQTVNFDTDIWDDYKL